MDTILDRKLILELWREINFCRSIYKKTLFTEVEICASIVQKIYPKKGKVMDNIATSTSFTLFISKYHVTRVLGHLSFP